MSGSLDKVTSQKQSDELSFPLPLDKCQFRNDMVANI